MMASMGHWVARSCAGSAKVLSQSTRIVTSTSSSSTKLQRLVSLLPKTHESCVASAASSWRRHQSTSAASEAERAQFPGSRSNFTEKLEFIQPNIYDGIPVYRLVQDAGYCPNLATNLSIFDKNRRCQIAEKLNFLLIYDRCLLTE